MNVTIIDYAVLLYLTIDKTAVGVAAWEVSVQPRSNKPSC